MQFLLSESVEILVFILKSFLHIMPYLALTVPLALYLKRSGLSKRVEALLRGNAAWAVVIATLIGAISPFCSCSVIPVIAALLTGGVPLAPVMSFWLASPSMDPEIFILSVGTIGWQLAVWRLGATFAMSLGAGFLTLWLERHGLLGKDLLRLAAKREGPRFQPLASPRPAAPALALQFADAPSFAPGRGSGAQALGGTQARGGAGACSCSKPAQPSLLADLLDILSRLALFMGLAFFLEALIQRYVPQGLVAGLLGSGRAFAVPLATLIGIPFYTTELSALGIVGGLMAQGMSQPAALAFLIGGGVTTLPAMAAVWGIVKPRIFLLYLGFCVGGSLLAGYALQLVSLF